MNSYRLNWPNRLPRLLWFRRQCPNRANGPANRSKAKRAQNPKPRNDCMSPLALPCAILDRARAVADQWLVCASSIKLKRWPNSALSWLTDPRFDISVIVFASRTGGSLSVRCTTTRSSVGTTNR